MKYNNKKRILSWCFYTHPVALEALVWVEIEDKEHICPVKHDDLVSFMLGTDEGLEEEKRQGRKEKLIKYFFMNSHYLFLLLDLNRYYGGTLYQGRANIQTDWEAFPHQISGATHQQQAAVQGGVQGRRCQLQTVHDKGTTLSCGAICC